jgi:DNA-binding NtrC family response regulator
VLVLEDNEPVRRLAVTWLRRLAFEVTEAADAMAARTLFAPGAYHLLFSDVVLPDGDGFTLAEEFSRQDPGLKVLMTSGYVGAAEPAAGAGRWPLLHKPFRLRELEAAVVRLLPPKP